MKSEAVQWLVTLCSASTRCPYHYISLHGCCCCCCCVFDLFNQTAYPRSLRVKWVPKGVAKKNIWESLQQIFSHFYSIKDLEDFNTTICLRLQLQLRQQQQQTTDYYYYYYYYYKDHHRNFTRNCIIISNKPHM